MNSRDVGDIDKYLGPCSFSLFEFPDFALNVDDGHHVAAIEWSLS
jgi:hypothetical protein